jgi:hypothetical protein
MSSKSNTIDLFIKNVENIFVDDYEKINNGMIIVNEYLKEINFDYQYDYNTFCIELRDTLKNTLNKIDESVFNKINVSLFVYECINDMIRVKIELKEKFDQTAMIVNDLKNMLEKK